MCQCVQCLTIYSIFPDKFCNSVHDSVILWNPRGPVRVYACAADGPEDSERCWGFSYANILYDILRVKNKICRQGCKHSCDLAPAPQHKIYGTQANYRKTQWHNAIQLPHFHRWHHAPVGSRLAHWVHSVPSCSAAVDRKRQNNRGDDKDILKESAPYRI